MPSAGLVCPPALQHPQAGWDRGVCSQHSPAVPWGGGTAGVVAPAGEGTGHPWHLDHLLLMVCLEGLAGLLQEAKAEELSGGQ